MFLWRRRKSEIVEKSVAFGTLQAYIQLQGIVCLRPGQNGRAFAIYAEILKTIAVAHESRSRVKQICASTLGKYRDLCGGRRQRCVELPRKGGD
jgi:hypothetical protein